MSGNATKTIRGWITRLKHLEASLPATQAKAERAQKRRDELLAIAGKTDGGDVDIARLHSNQRAELEALQGALDGPGKLRGQIDALRADLKTAAALVAQV